MENNITDMYLLRNNTFLNQLSNMDNNVYKIISLSLAKLQKKLQKQFPEITLEIYSKLDDFMTIDIEIYELKVLGIERNSLYGKGLTNMLNKIRNTEINFISYITGNQIISGLVAQFEKDTKNQKIKASISKEVFMFLLDYNLNFRKQYNIEDLVEIKPSSIVVKEDKKLPKNLLAGYSKIDMKIIKEFRSYYTQIMFIEFKSTFEKQNINKTHKSNPFTINYSIDKIRNKFQLENKYKKYNDLKKNVIDTFVNELNKSQYMNINYEEIFISVRGGKKVSEIKFKITIMDKLLDTNNTIVEQLAITINENISEEQSLITKIYQSTGKKLSVKTIADLFKLYGKEETKRAINKLCIISDKDNKIKAPKSYLIKMLDNSLIEKEHKTKSQPKSNKFFNFNQPNYNYDKLESWLTGEEEWNGESFYND